MMKKIFALVLLLVLGKLSYAQYPITQTLGSDSTIVISKGALQSRLINVTYTDTTAANLQRIRQYPGAQIATTTGGLNLWIRNANATAWTPVATGSGNNIYTIDGTLLGNRTLTGAGYSLTFNQLSKLLFNADSTTINTDQATISNNGVSTLSVKGATGRMFLVDTTAPADERIYELKSSNGEFFISILNDAQTSNDSAFLITSASRVGINTLNPDSTLKVGGGVNILGGLRVGNLPTSPGTKQLRINAQGQFSVTDTLIDAGGTVTSVGTNNGSGITGGPITTTGTLAIDTTNVIATKASVSGGLAGKLNISDTAAMLAPYLRAIDTASLSNRINAKLNISDTATMLGNYLNNVGYGLSKVGQVASADSATLSAYYLRRKDSLTVTNPLGYVTQKILADTAAAIRSSDLGGTVTSVATNNGTGITGGTITTSGTLAIDTTVISTRAWRQKGVDSVATLANTKISGSLISGYLTKATGTLTVDTSQIYQNNGNIGIGTISPASGYKVDMVGSLRVGNGSSYNKLTINGNTVGSYLNFQKNGTNKGDIGPYSAVLGGVPPYSGSNDDLTYSSVGGHFFNTNAGIKMYLTNAGNLGLSASPDSMLTVLEGAYFQRGVRMSGLPSAPGTKALRINASGIISIADTLIDAGGTVTSVATNNGTGITGGTITTTGTLAIDTLLISTRAWRQKGVDSLQANINLKLNISDTASMLANYITGPQNQSGYMARFNGGGTIDTSRIFQNNGLIGINTTLPFYSLDVLGTARVTSNSYLATSSGVVGIGTTSADSLLTVEQGAWVKRGLRLSGLPTGTGTKSLRVDANGTVSLADTLANGISGTGTTNYVTKWTSSSAVGNSQIFDNGTNVGIGTNTPTRTLDVNGIITTNNNLELTSANPTILWTTSNLRFYNNTNGVVATISDIGQLTLSSIPNATTDTDKFLVSDGGVVKYRTGSEVLSDIGGASSSSISGTTNYIPKFTSSSAIGNSIMSEGSGAITVGGNIQTDGAANRYLKSTGFISNQLGQVSDFGANDAGYFVVAGGGLAFVGAGSERMRLDASGNLGLGTSNPSFKLDVNSGASNAYARIQTTGSVNWATLLLQNGDGTWYNTNNSDGNFNIGTGADPSDNIKLTLTSSGNLGLGVTPSAWASGWKALQIGKTTSIADNDFGDVYLLANAYYDGSSTRYIATGFNATYYGQENGAHIWLTAPSGTAGNAISFTQAMTLDASGRLGIGTTSPSNLLNVSGTGYVFNLSGGGTSRIAGAVNNTSGNLEWGLEGSAGNQLFTGMAAYQAGIGTSNNTSLNFATNTTVKMTITSGGLVGIGTTSPSGLLQLNGSIATSGDAATFTIKQSSTTYTNGIYLERGGERNGYYMYIGGGSDALTFRRNYFGTQSDVMSLTRDGNVGIGTTSPTGTGWNANSLAVQAYKNDTDGALFRATSSNTDFVFSAGNDLAYIATLGADPIAFYTDLTERMRITSGGNVGIGTSSPSGIFHAQATNSGIFFDLSTAYTPKIKASGALSDIQIESVGNGGHVYLNAPGSTSIVAINTNGSERMRITSGGLVGIGTTSPTREMVLYRSSGEVHFKLANGTTGESTTDGFDMAIDGSGGAYLINRESQPMHFFTNGSERMRITSAGELLINTTTDAGAYYLQVNGDVYAGAYYESSDRRLKDILSVRGGSDGINTVTFKWKDQRDSLSHIGYIAQEVEKVLPDAVKTNPNGYKTINYDEVQSLKIANLEQEIAELKKVIKQLIDKK